MMFSMASGIDIYSQLLISIIRINDITNSCKLLISLIRIVDISNSIADINNSNC